MADEYTSKAKIKAWLAWKDPAQTGDDTILDEIIAGVVRAFHEFTGRKLLSAAFTETLDGKGTDYVPLKNTPVTAVSSLTVDGTTIAVAANSQGYGYMIDGEEPNGGLHFIGSTRGFTRGRRNIVVTYTGGYLAIAMPGDILSAATRQASYVYRARTREGEKSRSIGDGTTVSFNTEELLPQIKTAIARHVRMR